VELTFAGVNVVSVRNAPVRAVSFLKVVTSPVDAVLVGGGVVVAGGALVVDESPPPPQAPNSAAAAHMAMYFIP
jgi:hypothetical protein